MTHAGEPAQPLDSPRQPRFSVHCVCENQTVRSGSSASDSSLLCFWRWSGPEIICDTCYYTLLFTLFYTLPRERGVARSMGVIVCTPFSIYARNLIASVPFRHVFTREIQKERHVCILQCFRFFLRACLCLSVYEIHKQKSDSVLQYLNRSLLLFTRSRLGNVYTT